MTRHLTRPETPVAISVAAIKQAQQRAESERMRKRHFIEALTEMWVHQLPDLRLGQLLCNAADKTPLFYMSDDDLLKAVSDLARRVRQL
jgi:hypothetical protein